MTERTDKWKEIFTELNQNNGYYEVMKVNVCNLASHLEELYLLNEKLKEDIELLKSTTRNNG